MKSISLSSRGIRHPSTFRSPWFRQGKSECQVHYSYHSRTVPCTLCHHSSGTLHFRGRVHLWSLRCSSLQMDRYWKREIEVLVVGLTKNRINNYAEIIQNRRNTLIRFVINKIILLKCTNEGYLRDINYKFDYQLENK